MVKGQGIVQVTEVDPGPWARYVWYVGTLSARHVNRMNPTRPPTSGSSARSPLWRRGLALVCCLLAFLTSGSPALLFPSLSIQTAQAEPGEGEERAPPVEEDDHGKDLDGQNNEAARSQAEQPGRHRRARQASLREARLAQLPRRHAGAAGHSLPSHCPFSSGAASLPLRC